MKSLSSTTRRVGTILAVPVAMAAAFVVATVFSNSPRLVSPAYAKTQASNTPAVSFTAAGELQRPTGYRKWIYVGTPLTPNDMNDGQAAFPEFHSVYINPQAYDQYEKTERERPGCAC